MTTHQTKPKKGDAWKVEPLPAAYNLNLSTPELTALLAGACRRIAFLEAQVNQLQTGDTRDLLV